ncbi:MAG: archaeal proteasome endopeptidase complex subunit beta [Methanobacteriaceae archaeon]|nr:archaeal proteasome endopeptidase complex subunit beta [Methanobacteriaceae archaeon]
MTDKDVKGTTTVGFNCTDGVVFATERRATMGNLVAHKVADKIFKIDDHIGATIAGSVSAAQTLMKYISAEVALYKLQNNKSISIDAAATVTANILKSSPLYVQTIIGGVDSTGCKVFSLDPSGGLVEDTCISTGSGSPFAYGVLEDRYNTDLTVEEGKIVALKAIEAAMQRDAFSGNGPRLATVTKDGFKRFSDEEIESLLKEI